MIEEETFPDTWEDQVALSALASLAATFLAHGYPEEAEFVSDTISSYILYEGTRIDSGSRRKLVMAAHASKLALYVTHQISWDRKHTRYGQTNNPFSIPLYLTSLAAYGRFEDGVGNLEQNQGLPAMANNPDLSAACYYLMTTRNNPTSSQQPIFASVQQKLAAEMEIHPELTPLFVSRVESLLRMSSLAALCEVAYKETLSQEPRLILNPNFLRHFTQTILQQNLSQFSVKILDPIAIVISTLLHIGNWSSYRDPLITKLLTVALQRSNSSWSFANLAVERIQHSLKEESSGEQSECLQLCHRLTAEQNTLFQRSREAKIQSAEKGYLGLLRNVLEGDRDLNAVPRVYSATPCAWASRALNYLEDGDGNNLLHSTARSGFLVAHKMTVELLGTVKAKPPLAALNNEGLAPIHIACKNRGHRNILMLCLYGGGDVNQADAFGRTALHYCFPEQHEMNEYLPALEEFIEKHGLLLTLPVNAGCVWGTMYNQGKKIDNRTYMLRALVRQLYCRGGSITVQDRQGLTPAHLAAKNGWGINSDLFFIGNGVKAEEESEECLRLKDQNGNSVLAMMRMNGDTEGERIISAEMRKRLMDTSVERNPQREVKPPPQNIVGSTLGGVSDHRPTASGSSDNTQQQNFNSPQHHPPSPWRQSPSTPAQISPTRPRTSGSGSQQQSGHLPNSQAPPFHQRNPSAQSGAQPSSHHQTSPSGQSVPPSPQIPRFTPSPQPATQPSSHHRATSSGTSLSPSPLPHRFSPRQTPHQPTLNPSPTHTPYSSSSHPTPNDYHQHSPSPALISHPPSSSQQPAQSYNPNIYRPPASSSHFQQQGQFSASNGRIYQPPMSQEQPQYPPGSPLVKKETMGSKFFNKLKKRL